MFELKKDTDGPDLNTYFGTSSPYWKLTSDSNALLMFGEAGPDTALAIELTAEQASVVRGLGGVTSTVALEIALYGEPMALHLVGRKIDSADWGGTAAHYHDTKTVARGLENSLSFAEKVVSEVNSLVIILDNTGKIKRFNRLCEEVTGMSETDLVGKNAHQMFMPETVRSESWDVISAFFRNERTSSHTPAGDIAFEVTRPINTKKGVRMIHWRNRIMSSGSGMTESYLVCSGTDVTEELEAKKRLLELASKDGLTGLPNRLAIEDLIASAVSAPDAKPFGLLFLDLDNFKKVNDHYGHLTGDELLKQVATAIREVLGEGDTLARLGGDEFLIKVDSDNAATLEATAQRILDRMETPFRLQRAEVYTGCSIGIAMFPEHGTTREELVRSADTAMYVAKEGGRRTLCTFTPEMNNKVSEYMWLDTNMRRALEEGQFELYYQPKVSLATGQVDSVEALVRWNHPERGIVSPVEFIPYAEESGLIVQLGRWVLDTAARQAGLWQAAGLNLRVAINLSARQLRLPTIVEDFKQALANNNMSPSLVDLELTESCLADDEKLAHRLISAFRETGAHVHLDDFGTGYSSLSQLTRLPLDALKLDASFIHSIHTDAKAQALVRSMVAVGHELHLKVVAEGVETKAQASFLRSIGVDYAQGYLFAKPMRIADFEAWMPAAKNKVRRLVA